MAERVWAVLRATPDERTVTSHSALARSAKVFFKWYVSRVHTGSHRSVPK